LIFQRRWVSLLALPSYFGVKVLSGLILLKLSSALLGVADFAIFSQFFLLSALLNMMAVGGAQNGLVRQTAAALTPADVGRARDAAFLLWGGAVLVVGLPVALASSLVADLLVGEPRLWWVVVSIAALAFSTAPGQIWCALLTGRSRPEASLVAQAAGLVAGTALAAAMLLRGDALLAALGFALGPALTMAVAWAAQRGERLPAMALAKARGAAKMLLGYSGAFVTLVAFTSTSLFALRGFYQDIFGLQLLGYWLTASRISDTTTQFLALFLLQYFLPGYTAAADTPQKARAVLWRSWALSVATMALFPAIFALAPKSFVRLFLAPEFLPAIPAIFAYMTGDVLRVWSAVAMQAAFARGRLVLFVGIEAATILLMGAIMLVLVSLGNPAAPIIAYPIAYATTALIVTVVFLRSIGRAEPSPARAAGSS
jgi:O-antigen/teichoic acid export membrane protein